VKLTIGFDSTIVYQDYNSEKTATKVETILDWAQQAGKDTGKCKLQQYVSGPKVCTKFVIFFVKNFFSVSLTHFFSQ
jgi:hypothetical protein